MLLLTFASRIKSILYNSRQNSGRRNPPPSTRANLEILESRELLSTTPMRIHSLAAAPAVSYYDSSQVALPMLFWQGLRGAGTAGQYLMTGTSINSSGVLFDGSIKGVGKTYAINFPNAIVTSVYGPDKLGGNRIRMVGIYRLASDPLTVHGFVYQGKISNVGFKTPANYRTIDIPGAVYNYVHSTSGGLAVGNYDSHLVSGEPAKAYIYNLANGKSTPILYPGSPATTAYGIWHNGGTSYTIAGGYSPATGSSTTGNAFVVDYNSATGQFSNWWSYSYSDSSQPAGYTTHFEGISSVSKGEYTLSGDAFPVASGDGIEQGLFVTIHRDSQGHFVSDVPPVKLNYPGTQNRTSANSVYGKQVIGIVFGSKTPPYQATVSR
jgi:hypothetical protein